MTVENRSARLELDTARESYSTRLFFTEIPRPLNLTPSPFHCPWTLITPLLLSQSGLTWALDRCLNHLCNSQGIAGKRQTRED